MPVHVCYKGAFLMLNRVGGGGGGFMFLVVLVGWFVCLSVCLSVDNITQKLMNGLG